MAPKITGDNTDHLLEITPTACKVDVDAQSDATVDFEIRYLGSGSSPALEARLVATLKPNWLESLGFRRPPAGPPTPDIQSWLVLPDLKLKEGLLEKGRAEPYTLNVPIRVPADVYVQPGDYDFRLALVDERGRILAQSQPSVTIHVNSTFTITPEPLRITPGSTDKKDSKSNYDQVCTIVVTHTDGHQGRARLIPRRPEPPPRLFRPQVARGLHLDWLSIDGLVEHDFRKESKYEYTVHLRVPKTELPGVYGFRLDMVDADNPDEGFTPGPVVTFTIRAFPWALLITLAALLMLIVGVRALRLPRMQVAASAPFQIRSNSKPTTKTTPNTIAAGNQFSYTLTITNSTWLPGRWSAYSQDLGKVVATLDEEATFVGVDSYCHKNQCCTPIEKGTRTITCQVPKGKRIRKGESLPITLTVQISPTQTKNLTQTLTQSLPLGKTQTNTYAVPVKTQPDLQTTWKNAPKDGNQNDRLIYELEVRNDGPSRSDPVTLTFETKQPSGLRPSLYKLTGHTSVESNTCQSDRLVQCPLGYLDPGATRLITITVEPGPNVTGIITNSVTLTGSDSPSIAPVPLTVHPVHGLTPTLTAERIGELPTKTTPLTNTMLLTYTIAVTNTGPYQERMIQVDFRVPDAITETVALGDIAAYVESSKHWQSAPKECSVFIKPVDAIPSSGTTPDQENWVRCAIDKLEKDEARRITVTTRPKEEDDL